MFPEIQTAERIWASLPDSGRAAMLRKLGHKELFAMTADAMTLVQITVRFGERLADSLVGELLATA